MCLKKEKNATEGNINVNVEDEKKGKSLNDQVGQFSIGNEPSPFGPRQEETHEEEKMRSANELHIDENKDKQDESIKQLGRYKRQGQVTKMEKEKSILEVQIKCLQQAIPSSSTLDSKEKILKKIMKYPSTINGKNVKLNEEIIIPNQNTSTMTKEKIRILSDLLASKAKKIETRREHQHKSVFYDIKDIFLDIVCVDDLDEKASII